MRHEYQARMPEASQKIKFFIGDVRDLASVKNAIHGVDYIFHAAALKQVPLLRILPGGGGKDQRPGNGERSDGSHRGGRQVGDLSFHR